MKYKLRQGDNLELLKKLPDNSVDAIVSDPPYGISFMSKRWDYDVPSVELWKEVYRVLKPGGHVLSFGGTRTYHRMVVNIEDAGFEIRDQIMWLYGSGFPKSHNIGKAVDKLQGNERQLVKEVKNNRTAGSDFGDYGIGDRNITKGNSQYEGWGTALKPANEPICVARKPLSEKSVALNVLKWGTGGINIDGCRIGSDTISTIHNPKITGKMGQAHGEQKGYIEGEDTTHEGRFPANIILECICDEVIKGEKGELKEFHRKESGSVYGGGKGLGDVKGNYISGDKGDIHTNPMCPCRLMDEQSGYLKGDSLNRKPRKGGHREQYVGTDNNEVKNQVVVDKVFDSGGASRFFYQAKVSKKERNMGLDDFEETTSDNKGNGIDRVCMNEGCGVSMLKPENCKCDTPDWRVKPKKNFHPTVKPVSLMAYLCRLVTPPGGTILDPYIGSGSTGIAALLEGFNFIGMDLDPEYVKIAEARIENYEKYREFLK
jgi:DNA modification methylase